MSTFESRPTFPPFTRESAEQKVRSAEDVWNGRNPRTKVKAKKIRQHK